jgi:Family of unknown function (DUF6427)
MLSFFKVNANYQFISLIILLVLLRLPFLLGTTPMLIPELNWMLVGEKMNQGQLLYEGIWDNISPFSAIVYWFIDSLFGRSQAAYQVFAALFMLFQALYFNFLSNQRQLFPDRTFVPGAIYLLFLNMSFDCSSLSPMLMATTFILLSFGTLIKHITREGVGDDVFEVGFYLSIACLFYFPSIIFIVWMLVSVLLYTGMSFRQLSLCVFGFVLPILLMLLMFFFWGALDDLNRNLFWAVIQIRQYNLNNIPTVILVLFIPTIITILGFLKTVGYSRFNNFQSRCQQIMMFWLLIAVFSILLMPYIAPMQFVILIPPMVFFTTNFFLIWRKQPWLSELIFTAAAVVIALLPILAIKDLLPNQIGNLKSLCIKTNLLPDIIKQQPILVVGQTEGEYLNNRPATPYLNWDLARYDFENVDTYDSVISIYDNFKKDPPQYIIDKQNIIPQIFKRLPDLGKDYKTTQWKWIYVRK